jgi:hypothetical protein
MITQERLKELLHYDPDTGFFTWKERPLESFKTIAAGKIWNKRFSNKVAGTVKQTNNNGTYHLSICCFSKRYPANRLAWLYIYGKHPQKEMDAIDGNFLNIKKNNLREATRSDTIHKSLIKKRELPTGVYLADRKNLKKKYYVKIMDKKKSIFIGRYETPEEAHNAYVEAKRQISPEFCML